MQPGITIFKTVSELTDTLAEDFYRYIGDLCRSQQKVNIVLSGGNTPQLLYKKIAAHLAYANMVGNWEKVHFFWGDERCVPPHHPESNYGMANRYLLRALNLKETNIHRIRGENKPGDEAIRYSSEVMAHVTPWSAVPVFDWIFLGMGDDGHTASIFPDQLFLLYADPVSAVAVHPKSGQQRITLTGKPLIHARRITFVVTGASKAQRVKEIIHDDPAAKLYPAKYIKPIRGKLEWFLDKEAAGLIEGTRDK
jgi:6-phosphogluconolactonase